MMHRTLRTHIIIFADDDPEDKSGNARRQEYEMQSHTEFSTELTKEAWPSFVQRVRLPPTSTRAR